MKICVKGMTLFLFTVLGCTPTKFSGSGGKPVQPTPQATAPTEIDVSPTSPAGGGGPTVTPIPTVPTAIPSVPPKVTATPAPAPTVAPVPPTPPVPPPAPNYGFTTQCEHESSGASLTTQLPSSGSANYTFYVQNNCPSKILTTDDSGKPVDIVFVIDATGSMDTNLATIKSNIIEFSNLIISRGGNSRFAAVGFRDEFNVYNDPPHTIDDVINFTSAADFKTKIETWVANEGDDWPEQGQMGIWKAVDMLSADANSNPDRRGAAKVIFYVSDAIAYLHRTLPWTFDLEDLLAKIAAARSTSLPRLQFYYSASHERHYSNNNDSRFIPPDDQMANLLTRSGLKGKGYTYPFQRSDFIGDFATEISRSEVEINAVCYPAYANVYNASNTILAGVQRASYQSVLDNAIDSRTRVNYPALNSSGGTYKLNVQRCCVAAGVMGPSHCVESPHSSNVIQITK